MTQLNSLAAQIDQYQSDAGTLPESLDQLVKHPGTPTAGSAPTPRTTDFKDPWHNAIEYRKPGDDDKPIRLVSLGVDGKPGGEGVDKDLVAP